MLTRAVNALRKRRPNKAGNDQDGGLASETETETEDCASCRSEPIRRVKQSSDTSTVSNELGQLGATVLPSGSDRAPKGGRRFANFSSSSSASSLLRLRSRSRSKDLANAAGLAQSTISSSNSRECCVNCGGKGGKSVASKGQTEKARHRQRKRTNDLTNSAETTTTETTMTSGVEHDDGDRENGAKSDAAAPSGGDGGGKNKGVIWNGFGLCVFFLECYIILLFSQRQF